MVSKIDNKGFTLVELLAVMVILVSIALVAVGGITSSLEKREIKECREQQELAISAAKIYFSLNNTATSVSIDVLNGKDGGEDYFKNDSKIDKLSNGDTITFSNGIYGYIPSDGSCVDLENNVTNGNNYVITYNYNFDISFASKKYLDTGYVVDWDKDFSIETYIKVTTSGKRYLIIGNYNGSDKKAFNIEINTSNKLRFYIGTGGVDKTSSDSVTIGEVIKVKFDWNALTDTYKISAKGDITDIIFSGNYSLSGKSVNTLRVGNVDCRGSSSTFVNPINVSFLEISTKEVKDTSIILPTLDREDAELLGWDTSIVNVGPKYLAGDSYLVSDNKTLYASWGTGGTIVLDYQDAANYSHNGDEYYEGSVQTYTVPADGIYTLEVWGAQGGTGTNNNVRCKNDYDKNSSGKCVGGYGGYSHGDIKLTKGTILYVYVGGRGDDKNDSNLNHIKYGGYNGGGNAQASYSLGSGGGATHIATQSGLLSSLSSSKNSILIVAGGGGGTGGDGNYGTTIVGHGGGYIGVTSEGYMQSPTERTSTGGTQSAGGDGYYKDGKFGLGASKDPKYPNSDSSGVGAGGGYYGGGAGVYDAGGGSGYIGNSNLTNKAMYCYYCTESTASSTKTVKTTNVSDAAISYYAKKGDGYARIKTALISLEVAVGSRYGTLPVPVRDGYVFKEWNTKSDGSGKTITSKSIVDLSILDSEKKLYAIWIKDPVKDEDSVVVNNPVLDDGMIPIIIKDDGTVITVSSTSSEWFNYEQKKWANAVLVKENGSQTRSYYKSNVGVVIPEDDILAYYVWIPRYKYKIWVTDGKQTTNRQTIEIDFEKASDSITKGSEIGDYMTHPAFVWDGSPVAGIWVGKFETGHITVYKNGNQMSCESINCSDADGLYIKPNMSSIHSNQIGKYFYVSSSMTRTGNPFGLSSETTDSHITKNTEWGAIAYLSDSKYGINGKIRVNNTRGFSLTTGWGALTDNADDVTPDVEKPNGIIYGKASSYPQSTTGNISGIFDMSGGRGEYVMANLNSTLKTSGLGKFPATKYYNIIPSKPVNCTLDTCGGMGIFETRGWYNATNSELMVSERYPWQYRGGKHGTADNTNTSVAIYRYGSTTGTWCNYVTYRSILIVQ